MHKRTKIWASGVSLSCLRSTFVKCSKVSLGSFGVFPGFDDLESTFDLNIQGFLLPNV